MVVQNPGAVVHAASSPASARPATSPWASASPQCSTRRRRPARACCAAAMSPTASTAGSELRIEASTSTAPSSTSRPAPAASSRARGDAGAEQDEVGGERLAAGQRARASAARCARRSAPRRTSTPASHSSAVMSSPARSPRRSACGTLLGRDEDDVDAAARQRGRRLAGDEARRRRPPRAFPAAPRRAGEGRRRPCGRCAGRDLAAPVHGRALRRRAGGEHAGVVGQLLAALEVHAARLAVEPRPRGARGAASRRARRTRPRPRAAGRRLELAAQQLLGQRRAVVGQVRLGAHISTCAPPPASR